jgi:putative transposase
LDCACGQRYVVGWMVADGESSELAKRLIADTCGKQQIEPGKLTIHADRGSSMTSKPVAFPERVNKSETQFGIV